MWLGDFRGALEVTVKGVPLQDFPGQPHLSACSFRRSICCQSITYTGIIRIPSRLHGATMLVRFLNMKMCQMNSQSADGLQNV